MNRSLIDLKNLCDSQGLKLQPRRPRSHYNPNEPDIIVTPKKLEKKLRSTTPAWRKVEANSEFQVLGFVWSENYMRKNLSASSDKEKLDKQKRIEANTEWNQRTTEFQVRDGAYTGNNREKNMSQFDKDIQARRVIQYFENKKIMYDALGWRMDPIRPKNFHLPRERKPKEYTPCSTTTESQQIRPHDIVDFNNKSLSEVKMDECVDYGFSQKVTSSETLRPLFTAYTIEFDKSEDLNVFQEIPYLAKPLKDVAGEDNDSSQITLKSKPLYIKEDLLSKNAPKLEKQQALSSLSMLVDESELHGETLDKSRSYIILHIQKSKPRLMRLYDSLDSNNPNKVTTLYVNKSVPRKIKAYYNYANAKKQPATYTILNSNNSAHCEMKNYTSCSSSRYTTEILYVHNAYPTKMIINNPGSPVYTPFYVNKELPLKMIVPQNWDHAQNLYLHPTMLHDENYYEYLPYAGNGLSVRIKENPNAKKQ